MHHALEAFVKAGEGASWKKYSTGLDSQQKTELKRFSDRDYDVMLGMLERRVTEDVRSFVAEILSTTRATNVLHKAVDRLARRYGRLFVATTNFDRLHEEAGRRGRNAPPSYGLRNLPRPSRRESFHGIFHIHGGLPLKRNEPFDIVLTDQDFGDAYMRRRVTSEFIYDVTRIFHLVIIGYSFGDAPFRYLLNAVAGDSEHFPDLKQRYAIVPRRGGDETVEVEWRARSIQPVCYDDKAEHAQLQELLTAWADSVPVPGTNTWAEQFLTKVCKVRLEEASPDDRSLFGYIMRRSLPTERQAMLGQMGESGAHPDWLSEAIAIIREPRP